MRLTLAPFAEQDLEAIGDYICGTDEMVRDLSAQIDRLALPGSNKSLKIHQINREY